MIFGRVLSLGLVCLGMLLVPACGPAEPPPPVDEEAPPPPPPPPPTLYDLSEVDIVTQEPEFTSRNVSFLGVRIGDITNDMLDVLGEQQGDTQNIGDHYVSNYKNGGLVIHTFKTNGEIRKIEIFSRLSSRVVSAQLRSWLEDGDVEDLREFMGPEEDILPFPEIDATEYAYDSRGLRFVTYGDQNGVRFSYYR